MPNAQLKFIVSPRSETNDEYDYIDVEIGNGVRVGKVRCLFRYETVTIFNITVFEEYERKGYGRRILDRLKAQHEKVIADKVRYSAQAFWSKMDFKPCPDGNWEWRH